VDECEHIVMNTHLICRGSLRWNKISPCRCGWWTDNFYSSVSPTFFSISRYYSSNQSARNPYDVLGVHRQATKKEIKSAYIRQSKLCHPDRNRHNTAAAAVQFNEIREAYEELIALKQNETQEQQQDPSSADPSWQEDFSEYKDTRYSYNGTRYHGTRNRARTVDDWIKEVERNARLRKKQQGNSYRAYSQGQDESSQGSNNNAHQWATGPKYQYFWKTNERMEKDYSKFETRVAGDLDRLLKYFMVVDFCFVWLLFCLLLK